MAKITITIEDEGENVKIVADPTFETMAMMTQSGHILTAAHGYALAMINRVRQISKSKEPKNLIYIPKIGRS